MPAKSKKQLKFMQAVANNPKFAKKVGVPTKVGKEFTKETEMKYEKGGKVKKGYHKMPDGTVMKDSAHKMKHGGMVGKCKRDGIATRGKTKAGR